MTLVGLDQCQGFCQIAYTIVGVYIKSSIRYSLQYQGNPFQSLKLLNMVSFKKLLSFTTAVTASIPPPPPKRITIAQVEDDVTAIDTSVKTLTSAVNSYTGGYLAALPLLTDLTAVYGALYKGVFDSGLLPSSISSSDVFSLINYVNQTLAIDNPIAIEALEAKKSYFQDEGLDGIIVAAIGLLKAGHDAFSFNALQRVPADAVGPAKEVIEVIDAALQNRIDSFEAKN